MILRVITICKNRDKQMTFIVRVMGQALFFVKTLVNWLVINNLSLLLVQVCQDNSHGAENIFLVERGEKF